MSKTYFLSALVGAFFGSAVLGQSAERFSTSNAATELSNTLADIVERSLPGVVVIRTEANRYFVDRWTMRYYKSQQPLGQGSGVLIRPDGYIITNRHVLQDAEVVEVALDDGRVYPARYIGSNAQTDIAVIKIDPSEGETLPVLEPADSDAVRVGEMVLAIGSPFSLNSTVTQGIVSQKGRSTELLPLVDFIQTSAPINPGNSGGALVDMDGRFIGINTFIQTANPHVGGNIGIGFAVPSKTAMRVAELLIKGENSDLPWMGIEMADMSGRNGTGILVRRVFPDSPAEKSGLKPGDIITQLNGRPVQGLDSLRGRVGLSRPGETMKLDVVRGGKSLPITVILERMPAMQPFSR